MKKRILIGLGIVLAVVGVALGGSYYMLDKEVSKIADDEMLRNIYIEDKDVSGMKVEEIRQFFEEKLSSYREEKVVLKLGGRAGGVYTCRFWNLCNKSG